MFALNSIKNLFSLKRESLLQFSLFFKGGYVFLTGGYEAIMKANPDLSIKDIGTSFVTFNVGIQKDSYYNTLISKS